MLGKALPSLQEKVVLEEDLPLLGLKKGEYGVHSLLYYNFLKCFYNATFGEKYSTLVNYDWYHPPFAYRYTIDEMKAWFHENNLEITETISADVQHYVTGVRIPT